MNKKGKVTGMAKKALAIAMATAMVLTLFPVSSDATAKVSISGSKNVTITKSTQKSTAKAPTQTLKLKNVSTKTYSIKWTTSNPKIVKLPSKTANKTSIKVTPYYKKGNAIITATYTHKKNKKKKTVKATIRVYQGATSVGITDSDGANIKGQTSTIALTDSFKMTGEVAPTNIDASSHKVLKWSVSDKNIGTVTASGTNSATGTFKAAQAKLIGRGDKTVTVTAASNKNASNAKATTKITVQGGEFVVSDIDTRDLTILVGVTKKVDVSVLKGSKMTLAGVSGTAIGKEITATYAGYTGGKAIYTVDKEDDMTAGTGEYNGRYEIKSFVDGNVFADGDNKVTYEENLTESEKAAANVESISIDNKAFTVKVTVTTPVAAKVLDGAELDLVAIGTSNRDLFAKFDSVSGKVITFKLQNPEQLKDIELNDSYVVMVNRPWTFENGKARIVHYTPAGFASITLVNLTSGTAVVVTFKTE